MKENREEIKRRIINKIKGNKDIGIADIQKQYGIGFTLAKEIYCEVKNDVRKNVHPFL